jgi:membrane associated rhomboid family serine protease
MAASLGTQLQDWFVHLPLATRSITALCCAIYVAGLFLGHDDISVCIFPPKVVEYFQGLPPFIPYHPSRNPAHNPETTVYRLLTAGFFHVGILHLVMNMFAFQVRR